jgi:membrane-associated phospholipid phosphatase
MRSLVGVRYKSRMSFEALDRVLVDAAARPRHEAVDDALRRLSTAANWSRLWLAASAAMALTGPQGRRAARDGLASIALASLLANQGVKPLVRRTRPEHATTAERRRVRMPGSTSFPSGHAASAFAFATAAGRALPPAAPLLVPLAAVVAYSRVHTGVHYPTDVAAGAALGVVCGLAAPRALRRSARRA